MSVHRYAAKRDENEPDIIKALRAHGCVVWQLSGKGIPDLLVLHKGKKWLADVKMPGKPTTKPQEELWEEAATKARCSVFILRTPEDAVKMLNNALYPWEPATAVGSTVAVSGRCTCGSRGRSSKRRHGTGCPEHPNPPRKGDAEKRHRCGKNGCRNLRPCVDHDGTMKRTTMEATENYAPPRSKSVDAAKEAEETFAPGGCQCGRCSDCYGVVPDPDLDR
jgi:hypothetical protein